MEWLLPLRHLLLNGRTKLLQRAHYEQSGGTEFMQEACWPLKTVLVVKDYADSRFMVARLPWMSGYRFSKPPTAARVGCDHFVVKPVDFDQLLELVRERTEGAGARAYAAPPNSLTLKQPCV